MSEEAPAAEVELDESSRQEPEETDDAGTPADPVDDESMLPLDDAGQGQPAEASADAHKDAMEEVADDVLANGVPQGDGLDSPKSHLVTNSLSKWADAMYEDDEEAAVVNAAIFIQVRVRGRQSRQRAQHERDALGAKHIAAARIQATARGRQTRRTHSMQFFRDLPTETQGADGPGGEAEPAEALRGLGAEGVKEAEYTEGDAEKELADGNDPAGANEDEVAAGGTGGQEAPEAAEGTTVSAVEASAAIAAEDAALLASAGPSPPQDPHTLNLMWQTLMRQRALWAEERAALQGELKRAKQELEQARTKDIVKIEKLAQANTDLQRQFKELSTAVDQVAAQKTQRRVGVSAVKKAQGKAMASSKAPLAGSSARQAQATGRQR